MSTCIAGTTLLIITTPMEHKNTVLSLANAVVPKLFKWHLKKQEQQVVRFEAQAGGTLEGSSFNTISFLKQSDFGEYLRE